MANSAKSMTRRRRRSNRRTKTRAQREGISVQKMKQDFDDITQGVLKVVVAVDSLRQSINHGAEMTGSGMGPMPIVTDFNELKAQFKRNVERSSSNDLHQPKLKAGRANNGHGRRCLRYVTGGGLTLEIYERGDNVWTFMVEHPSGTFSEDSSLRKSLLSEGFRG